MTLDNAVVIKTSQDISITNKERHVIYFFIGPEPGQDYIVYRAIVDYDETTEETKVMVLAFDVHIKDSKITC